MSEPCGPGWSFPKGERFGSLLGKTLPRIEVRFPQFIEPLKAVWLALSGEKMTADMHAKSLLDESQPLSLSEFSRASKFGWVQVGDCGRTGLETTTRTGGGKQDVAFAPTPFLPISEGAQNATPDDELCRWNRFCRRVGHHVDAHNWSDGPGEGACGSVRHWRAVKHPVRVGGVQTYSGRTVMPAGRGRGQGGCRILVLPGMSIHRTDRSTREWIQWGWW